MTRYLIDGLTGYGPYGGGTAVTPEQFLALMRGETISVGGRPIGPDDGPFVLSAAAPAVERGGPGSGHFEHAGRPGLRGGSLPSGRARFSEGTRFRYQVPGQSQYAEATSLAEALDRGGGHAWVVDPRRGLSLNVAIQGSDYSGLPEGIDYEAEVERALDVYDHLQSLLADPANAAWLEAVDRDGIYMRNRALEYTRQVAQGDPYLAEHPRMGLNVIFTNNRESAGAGSAGDWGGRVFWVPTSLEASASVLENGVHGGFRFGCSPVYVTIHELHHAWGSGSELDAFSEVVAADYALAHRDLLTPGVEQDMVHDLWGVYHTASSRASGGYREMRLAARAAMGWFYERNGDYLNGVFTAIEGNIANPNPDFIEENRVAWEWIANPTESREDLGKWARQERSRSSPST